ncbi:MAG: valine--tRNA ligase [Candidatus Moranbacteria bacterium]|nr:valine--tRNA ligase [Candidatus Moranbacteria bacterium]
MEQNDIPKAYDPKEWEEKLYQKWEESGFFNPDTCIEKGVAKADASTFSIVLPPPNVTGHLHAGHAAMLAIEDSIVRYHRMKGERTLWLPGTDHAAIATQSKVESIIRKVEGKTRHDFSREEFLERVRHFAQDSHDRIAHQIRKMGSSVDWSREAFTLDDKRSLAVRTAFKKMYDDGLIYQGDRIVNWDPHLQTTVSDDEIERKEEKSRFYYLKYGPFIISTARPETKFGDKYVVMHPDDGRYAEYRHGQKIELEWISGPITATVIKDAAVDPTFGTGVMTITPWHDAIDFEIAERHRLESEQIIGFDGKLLDIAGAFAGEDILEAREKIIERLTEKGLVEKIDENYVHSVATNSRGGGLIEPQIKKQWFVAVNREFERDGKMVTLKSLMRDAVAKRGSDDQITILPEQFEKVYFHWIDNLRDWCISRQIWYGHRIPVWYRKRTTGNGRLATDEEETEIYCGIEAPEGDGWEQDPDTLDTWFSSGLWTFSTLGWPACAETATAGQAGPENDLANYHPTTLLETGYDILFFWVARMVLMSEYLRGERPFDTVYLHGLVRDGQGRKMSKSLGNTIDPLDVSEVHGADAMRMALLAGNTPGNDIRLSDEKIVSMRNFTNKLWNLARYVGTMSETVDHAAPEPKSDTDRDLLEKLHRIVVDVTRHLDRYELSMAIEMLREFTWGDFADWYVEAHKVERNDALLRHAFDVIIRLWHPFMPFVTEAIHETLHLTGSEILMVAKWPEYKDTRTTIANENRFALMKNVIIGIRNVRATYRIDPAKKLIVSAYGGSEKAFRENELVFKRLARISEIRRMDSRVPPKDSLLIQSGLLQAYLHLEDVVDIDIERARLGKELANTEAYAKSLEAKLGNPSFAERAPEAVVAQTRSLLDETRAKAEELRLHLGSLV